MVPEPPDPPERPSGFVTGIDRLLVYFSGLAVGSAHRASIEWDVAGYSIAGIVASAAAVEATVGEYLAIPANESCFASEIEEWKKSLPRPYDVMKTIIKKRSGKDVGPLRWYDRMRCLFELRNHLVHYRPQIRAVGTFPDDLQDCIRKHAITPGGDDSMDWTSRLLLPDIAAQAARIAQEAIHGFLDEAAASGKGAA
jgi:hypothetical protein